MKPALYVPTSSLETLFKIGSENSLSETETNVLPLIPEFFSLDTYIGDRADIETDETKLQVLPYITLLTDDGRVYVYSRGGAGKEARLIGNLSVGLGGHVDTEVPGGLGAVNYAAAFKDHLIAEACRELKEEVGLDVNPDQLVFEDLIYDKTNSVGRVHLGLRVTYKVTGDEALTLEQGVIEKGEFRTLDSITDEEFDRLENWSKVVVTIVTASHPEEPCGNSCQSCACDHSGQGENPRSRTLTLHKAVDTDTLTISTRKSGLYLLHAAEELDAKVVGVIAFQDGPVPEVGINGVTIESLLAIAHDRLSEFQLGKFPSTENANALLHIKLALNELHARTLARIARGVEGQLKA